MLIRDMINFKFSEKGRGPVSRPYCVYEFSRKLFLMLYSINWPKLNLIVWLPLLLEILGKYAYCNCLPIYDVTNFDINPSFLNKPFFYMSKKSGDKFEYLKIEKRFNGEIKNIFHQFQRALSCKNLSQTWVWTFNEKAAEIYSLISVM